LSNIWTMAVLGKFPPESVERRRGIDSSRRPKYEKSVLASFFIKGNIRRCKSSLDLKRREVKEQGAKKENLSTGGETSKNKKKLCEG